jgi:hypothetical protein
MVPVDKSYLNNESIKEIIAGIGNAQATFFHSGTFSKSLLQIQGTFIHAGIINTVN